MSISEKNLELYLKALSDELVKNNLFAEILLFGGGALVAFYCSRDMTHDLDIKILDNTQESLLLSCAAVVAEKFNLESDWINTEADKCGYVTQEIVADSGLWLKYPALHVLRPSTKALLAMKINAARIHPSVFDIDDAAHLLSELKIDSVQDAIAVWKDYYPNAPFSEVTFREKNMFLNQALYLKRK